MKKLTTYLLTFAMLSLPKIEANVNENLSKNSIENRLEIKEKELSDVEILAIYEDNIKKLPRYKLKKEQCAAYVRLSAEKLFKKQYITGGKAWNMRYHNKIISEIKDTIDIMKLIRQKKIKPGMAVGFYNPHSNWNDRRDEKGKKVTYTHVALYIGVNKNLEPEFIHQERNKIKKSNLTQMEESHYKPKIVLDSNN